MLNHPHALHISVNMVARGCMDQTIVHWKAKKKYPWIILWCVKVYLFYFSFIFSFFSINKSELLHL